jgi:hypothetical protein
MVTIICYIYAGRYRTTKSTTKMSLAEAWLHISRCPHGHEMSR